jgi:hypothetical protein
VIHHIGCPPCRRADFQVGRDIFARVQNGHNTRCEFIRNLLNVNAALVGAAKDFKTVGTSVYDELLNFCQTMNLKTSYSK